MTNKYGHKLVVIAEPGVKREFHLSDGRNTIGSAPGNDVIIDGRGVSGYHAEFRIEKNRYYILDFSSEKGTYVNTVRVAKEKRVYAGDIVQLGTARTVFIASNAIIAKEESYKKSTKGASKSGAMLYRNWTIVACVFLVVLSALKISLSDESTVEVRKNKRVEMDDHSARYVITDKIEQQKTISNSTLLGETGSTESKPKSALVASVDNKKKPDRPDETSIICINIAKKFSDHQLWSEALEYYRIVFERDPDFPELSGQIAKVRLEKENMATYHQGVAFIEEGSFSAGINSLKKIDPDSFYYNDSLKAISYAKAKKVQSIDARQ
jgi:pSer/pThr/pTyr-binding forkhead associated (FHA) protein